MALSVDIEKKLGDFCLKVKFETTDGVMALLGASGSGKSMTLKCIAGIEKPDRGKIVLNGVTLFDSEKKINLSPQKRKVGYLFQQYALFPDMTVEQNIACGVREKKNVKEMTEGMIRAMNLQGVEQLKPMQLSGGQQQRVAIARILVNEPEVLLLDEPFSALDSYLKFQVEREVGKIMREFGKTVVLVSHNRDEVFRLSDSIGILNDGMLELYGEKKTIFKNPETKTGALLTGCKNLSVVEHSGGDVIYAKDWGVKLRVPGVSKDVKYVGMRLHDLKFAEEDCENSVRCEVTEVMENPFSVTVMLHPIDCETKGQFGMELDKTEWIGRIRDKQKVCFSLESLLLLRE